MVETERSLRRLSREWLESGENRLLVGTGVDAEGIASPRLFSRPEETDALVLSPRSAMAHIVRKAQSLMDEEISLGVVARGCDQKALVELGKLNQVNVNRLDLIGVACTREEAQLCWCKQPYPLRIHVGDAVEGVDPFQHPDIQDLFSLTADERWERWRRWLSRCIKCYGCRNACPLCVCPECKIAMEEWAPTGRVPPDPLAYHLIRAFHLADKCVSCGACQMACPAGIPLKFLYIGMGEYLKRTFDYAPGTEPERHSPVNADLAIEPILGRDFKKWTST